MYITSDLNYEHLLTLSNRLKKANEAWHRLPVQWYWQVMYLLNRLLETLGYPRHLDITGEPILNFGCGVHLTRGINSDLFALHRYLKRRRRPDIYLSGATTPKSLRNRFATIICEHVLEHMLPAQARLIMDNFYQMLRPGGALQISVPSLSRLIAFSDQLQAIDILAINDIAYNYGHKFLHDENSVIALARDAGFSETQVNSYATSPWREYLLAEREPQSIYVIATKPQS